MMSLVRENLLSPCTRNFNSDHVPDIVGTSRSVPAAGTMTKQKIIAALKDTCVMMDERKAQFELMIHPLERERMLQLMRI